MPTIHYHAATARRDRKGQPKRLVIEASSGSGDAAREVRSGPAEHARIGVIGDFPAIALAVTLGNAFLPHPTEIEIQPERKRLKRCSAHG
jgi:hypothetical protein